MRLIFVNRFAWPEEPATAQLLTDLSEALAAAGHEVAVIASRPSGAPRQPDENRRGVRLLRVGGPRWGRAGLVGRAADFLRFLAAAGWRLLRIARPGDCVIALTDPPFLGVVATACGGVRGARVLHWTQDLYPEIALALSPPLLVRVLGSALRPCRDLAWRRSRGCVVLGREMEAHILRAGVTPTRVSVIPNWAPAGLGPQPSAAADALRERWGLRGSFVVAYSGNLGRVHDLFPVIELAAALRETPSIQFVFIGGGAQRADLQEAVRARALANVRFHEAQPRADLARTLALGDLHLVTLHPGCEGLVFPSKLYGIAAVGRPVLFIGAPRGELARLVAEAGFGLAFSAAEIPAMAAAVRALASDPARCGALGAAAAAFSRREGRLEHAVAAWTARLRREAAC